MTARSATTYENVTSHHGRNQRRLLALLLTSTIFGCASAAAVSFAQAQQSSRAATADQTLQFSIPAQPLSSAISAFIRQTGWQISYTSALASGKTSGSVVGSYNPSQALQRLVSGTGLNVRVSAPGSAALVNPGIAAVDTIPDEGSTVLDTILVQGQGETATSHFEGFAATRSATGTKTDTPLIETPQAVTVIGSDELRSRDAKSLQDALSYVAGVNRYEGADRTTESFIIRGFRALAGYSSLYRDGMKYQVNGYDGQQEPYGLERVEVLKGSSSVLYGGAAPGGIINTISKRPTEVPLREINVEYGSYNRKQISGDFGGPLTQDGDLSYRLTFLHRKSDTFLDYVPDDRTFIAPAIKWQPSDATSLTILGEYQHDLSKYQYGLPTQGTILPNPNGAIPRNRFNGEPGLDEWDNRRWSLGYQFEHQFSEQLTFHSNGRYVTSENHMPFTGSSGLLDDMRTTAWREYWVADRLSSGITIDNSLQYDWSLGSMENRSLVGLDYTDRKWRMFDYRASATPLDLFDPVYGGPVGELRQHGTFRNEVEAVGLYAQNQMTIDDRWVLLFGGRYDWANIDNKVVNQDVWTHTKSDAFTGRAGLVYLFDNGFAPYVSFAQGFEPVVGSDRHGGAFQPAESEQYEVGLRYQPPGMDLMFTASAYHLTMSNVTVADPVDRTKLAQMGEVRSQGIELEARGRLGNYWDVAAAYAYTDARTVRSSVWTPELEGRRTGGVPYNSFSLWADYDFEGLGAPGLKIGGGLRYVGETEGLYVKGTVPAYTVVDASISYTRDDWKATLSATNLFDKNYAASCTSDCFYGEPLNVKFSLSRRW